MVYDIKSAMASINLRRDHQSLRDRVREVVRDRIIGQRYRGGERLTLDELATDLGVSATPVRDALAQLERDGLVRLNARGTAVVRKFTRKDVVDVFDLRLAVEPLAARLASPRITPDAPRLRAALQAGLAGLADGRPEAALEADRAIHAAILDACDNDRVVAVVSALAWQVEVFRVRGARAGTSHRYLIHFDALVEACEGADGAAAEVAMRRHLEVSRDESLADFERWRE